MSHFTDIFLTLCNCGNSGFSVQFRDFALCYENGPDDPGGNVTPEPQTDIGDVNIIRGNTNNNKKTYYYRTTVTFTANVPDGGSVRWYVDGKPAGTGRTLTVKEMESDYTVKAVVTDKYGNRAAEEEQVIIKHGFFDILAWFFIRLISPGSLDVKQ